MSKIIKQVVGIDIALEKFDVCFQEENESGKRTIKGSKSFTNDLKGFKAYWDWFHKRKKDCSLTHIMESTGVYHENLCYFLYDNQEQVSVQLAQKVKYFGKSLHQKTKTDKADAKVIALYGLSVSLDLWKPISADFKDIRDLCRIINHIKKSRTADKSRLKALESKYKTPKNIINVLKSMIKAQNKSIEKCEQKIKKMVKADEEFNQKIERICKMKGVGFLTVVKLLAETDGFRKCSSIRKLVSYSGLDVVENQSGNKIGRSRISKKGNAHIREALYMPALSASQHNKQMKTFYDRLTKRQTSNKQGIVSVMRKMLIVIYSLWKTGAEYNPNHQWN